MKASEASVRIALASQSVPMTRISDRILGRIWRARMRASEKPSARQASTKSRDFMTMVGARATRAKVGTEVSAIAAMMLGIDGPSIATIMSPRIRVGNASRMSIASMATASRRPPRQPASMPMAEPITIAAKVEATPMISEKRAPCSSRDSVSRPK